MFCRVSKDEDRPGRNNFRARVSCVLARSLTDRNNTTKNIHSSKEVLEEEREETRVKVREEKGGR